MRSGVGRDEGYVGRVGGMVQEHLFGQQAAQAVCDEDNIVMLPNTLLIQRLPKQLGKLRAGVAAAHGWGWVFGDNDVGVAEVRVGAQEVRPVGAVGGSPRIAAAMQAVNEDDDPRFGSVGAAATCAKSTALAGMILP